MHFEALPLLSRRLHCGSNGQLGTFDTQPRNSPTLVRFAVPVRLAVVAAGVRHSVAVDMEGRLWSWGTW